MAEAKKLAKQSETTPAWIYMRKCLYGILYYSHWHSAGLFYCACYEF